MSGAPRTTHSEVRCQVLLQYGDGRPRMANVVKPAWFGRQVTVMLSTQKTVAGELAEVSEHYIILNTAAGERQIMVHAIVAIWPTGEQGGV